MIDLVTTQFCIELNTNPRLRKMTGKNMFNYKIEAFVKALQGKEDYTVMVGLPKSSKWTGLVFFYKGRHLFTTDSNNLVYLIGYRVPFYNLNYGDVATMILSMMPNYFIEYSSVEYQRNHPLPDFLQEIKIENRYNIVTDHCKFQKFTGVSIYY